MLEPPRDVTGSTRPPHQGPAQSQGKDPPGHWLRRSLLDAYCHCSLRPMPQILSGDADEPDDADAPDTAGETDAPD